MEDLRELQRFQIEALQKENASLKEEMKNLRYRAGLNDIR